MDKDRIIDLMAGKGLTQSTLATRAKVSRASVYRLVSKGSKPRLDTLGRIARVLDVKPSELVKK